MTINFRTERRYLTDAEIPLVEQSHFPALLDVPDDEIGNLLSAIRQRRDRARDLADRQRREVRGKASPKGASAATGDTGSRQKVAVLAAAVQRVSKERARRKAFAAKAALIGNAERALEMRRESFRRHHPKPGRTAHGGMKAKPNTRRPRIAEPMEVGRVSQFVKDGQARRDSR